jgi:8-oxo-dGTP pyrophosphatase MutT (NUDIX family)
MKKVSKLVVVDSTGQYLLLHRSDHPKYGTDPDLPGGTVEADEDPLEAVIRETAEETEVRVDGHNLMKMYEGSEYSTSGTNYSLYMVVLEGRPNIILSWEHSAYEWLDRDAFLEKAKSATDTYMHMVYETLVRSV